MKLSSLEYPLELTSVRSAPGGTGSERRMRRFWEMSCHPNQNHPTVKTMATVTVRAMRVRDRGLSATVELPLRDDVVIVHSDLLELTIG